MCLPAGHVITGAMRWGVVTVEPPGHRSGSLAISTRRISLAISPDLVTIKQSPQQSTSADALAQAALARLHELASFDHTASYAGSAVAAQAKRQLIANCPYSSWISHICHQPSANAFAVTQRAGATSSKPLRKDETCAC
jgi:hypothetical protein